VGKVLREMAERESALRPGISRAARLPNLGTTKGAVSDARAEFSSQIRTAIAEALVGEGAHRILESVKSLRKQIAAA